MAFWVKILNPPLTYRFPLLDPHWWSRRLHCCLVLGHQDQSTWLTIEAISWKLWEHLRIATCRLQIRGVDKSMLWRSLGSMFFLNACATKIIENSKSYRIAISGFFIGMKFISKMSKIILRESSSISGARLRLFNFSKFQNQNFKYSKNRSTNK